MKKISVFLMVCILVCSVCSSCDKAEIKETSVAGAYYLMFKEFAGNKVDLTAYRYLSFDVKSTGLEGEDLEILEGMIKEYCEEMDIDYLDMDMTRLKRSLKIKIGANGDVFTNGYLLTYEGCRQFTDEDGQEVFIGSMTFWHGDFDAMGGLDFIIKKTDKGWYIDRERENGGYDTLIS
ncbi:MAG: hypothetical protein E7675_08445 [Ruminococcaceae bacterium]|nr:hypothetical protein [Oscillospiraceae bacterium]